MVIRLSVGRLILGTGPGDLERLRRFWLTGTCNPKKEEKRSSEPLAPEQFLSAFFILMMGALLAAGLCSMEHVYFKYLRQSINKTEQAGCCALLSLVSMEEEDVSGEAIFSECGQVSHLQRDGQ